MPSVHPVSGEKTMLNFKEFVSNPMKPAIKIVEHKIRNLEKRKVKLDQYKSEQDDGKELNADQLAAVAKYGEVIQQLEFARDLVKQFGQVNDETRREIKKHQKAELAERSGAEFERFRTYMLLQAVMNQLRTDSQFKEDVMRRAPGVPRHLKDNEAILQCTSPFATPIEKIDDTFDLTLDISSRQWMLILDGSKHLYSNTPEVQLSYRQIRDDILAIANSQYVAKLKASPYDRVEETEAAANDNVSDSESVPLSVTKPNITQSIPVSSVPIQESTYSFLQDSQIDLESPHFDPAVVAVSSYVPPSMVQQLDFSRSSGLLIAAVANSPTNTSSSGTDEIKIELGKLESIHIDDEITEWNPNLINSSGTRRNGNKENKFDGGEYGNNDDYSNRFGSTFRGGPRGGRGNRRGNYNASNGVARGVSRGNNNRGGFSNDRMGYYRPEHQENGYENKDFRGGRGGAGRGFRRGNAQGNNFPSSRGNSGFRGRGSGGHSRPPRTSESNGIPCYS